MNIELTKLHVQPTANVTLHTKTTFYNGYTRIPEIENESQATTGKSSYRTMFMAISFFLTLIGLAVLALTRHENTNMTAILSNITPFKVITHPDIPTSLWGSVKKPYPTGAFWTNLVVGEGDGAVGLYPYGIKTLNTGVQVSYGAFRRSVTNLAIQDIFTVDLELSSVESIVSRAVESYDDLSVTMTYKVGSSTGKFSTYLVKCSPFVTVAYTSATPIIRSPLMHIIAVDAQVVTNSTGVQYIVTLGNFEKWLVYCSVPITLLWTGDTLTSTAIITGVLRVAVLPLQNTMNAFSSLMQYVRKYPTGATTTLSYVDGPVGKGTVQIDFKTVGSGSLLLLAVPHQIPLFQSPVVGDPLHLSLLADYGSIYSIKGKLRPVVGERWCLVYEMQTPGWSYTISQTLAIDDVNTIATNLLQDVNSIIPSAADPYTFGKQLGRMCALALIADSLGVIQARATAIMNIENAILPWLQGRNSDFLLYDSTYGGIVTNNGLADKYADFGSGWYSDHHFHYGYFLYAGAVLAKFDSPFYSINQNAFDSLALDVCNFDKANTNYPFARHKDFFDGHSWASGLYQQSNGKGQESSSEAINAYYGAYLYGLSTSNLELTDFAKLLMFMEIQAAQTYWHMSSDTIYDNVFAATNRMVGNIGALDVTSTTWFGADLKYVHGINMMPLTPVSSFLFDAQYVELQYPVLANSLPPPSAPVSPQCSAHSACSSLGLTGSCCPNEQGQVLGCCDNSGNNPLSDEFVSYVYADLAVVSRCEAWTRILAQSSFGNGNSKSNSLMWAATRAPPVVGFNETRITFPTLEKAIQPQCTANTACDVLGILGNCCPTKTGIQLGCCPVIVTPDAVDTTSTTN